jgi:hypothetical protein
VPGSRPNPRDTILPSEYLGTYALKKDGVLETFVCLIMFQDINRVVEPPVTLKGQGSGRTRNVMIILKILRKSNRNSVKSNTEMISEYLCKILLSFVHKQFLAKLQIQRKIFSRFAKFTLPHSHPHEKINTKDRKIWYIPHSHDSADFEIPFFPLPVNKCHVCKSVLTTCM